MNDTESVVKLMDKNVDDLTVGEALKVNLGILAVMAAIPVAIVSASYVKGRFTDWNMRRKEEKFKEAVEG